MSSTPVGFSTRGFIVRYVPRNNKPSDNKKAKQPLPTESSPDLFEFIRTKVVDETDEQIRSEKDQNKAAKNFRSLTQELNQSLVTIIGHGDLHLVQIRHPQSGKPVDRVMLGITLLC